MAITVPELAKEFQEALTGYGATLAPSEHHIDYDRLSDADKAIYLDVAEWIRAKIIEEAPPVGDDTRKGNKK